MILLIGFPKSGTSSFQKLFSSLGLNSICWKIDDQYIGMIIKNNKTNSLPLLKGLEQFDCITQMDVCVSKTCAIWPQIMTLNNYKNMSSFKRWFNYYDRTFTFSPELTKVKTDEGFIDMI